MPPLPPQQPIETRLPQYAQDPKILPMLEWLPDQPSYGNAGTTVAVNVVPRSQSSYGPMAALSSVGFAAIPALPFGAIAFYDAAGLVHNFAGTGTKIYRLHTGDSAWTDVTKVAATYSATAVNPWFFTSLGQTIVATDGADVPQKFTIGDANFTDLSASAPVARYITTVRNFIVLGNTVESATNFPQRIHWSAIGDGSSFPTLGTNAAAQVQSDAQDLRSDLGYLRGFAAGLLSADCAVFMDKGVYAVHYVGSPEVFSFQIAQGVSGCRAPYSIVSHRGYAYYWGNDGIKAFDGVSSRDLGSQRVDNYIFNNTVDGVDQQFLLQTQGAASLTGKKIFWIYCGPNSGGLPNRLLIYDWSLDRFSIARFPNGINFLLQGMGFGFSVEQLDPFGTVDTINPSLDSSYWQGGGPTFMALDGSHVLSTFTGANLAASVETAELQPSPGYRSRITNARPLIDGAPASTTVSLGYRVNLGDPVVYTTPVTMNNSGGCPKLVDSRYFRAQINIPAGTTWTHLQGTEIEFVKTTRR